MARHWRQGGLDNDRTKMTRGPKIILTASLSIGTALLLTVTLYRWTWDYNENGVHFDPDTMTTYHDGAILVYGLMTILFLIPTVMLIRSLKRVPSRQ